MLLRRSKGRQNEEEITTDIIDMKIGSSLPSEKLDCTNFASYKYKMHRYLVRQGYWSYIEGAQESQPNPTHVDYLVWEKATSRVLYCLAS